MDDPAPELTSRHLLYALVGAALLLAMGALVVASGLIAPWWAVAVLGAGWIAAVAVSVMRWRRRPYTPLLAGVAIAVGWVVLISVGRAMGWRP